MERSSSKKNFLIKLSSFYCDKFYIYIYIYIAVRIIGINVLCEGNLEK